MSETALIPMFPLSILPLPGELIPLHIYEPRFKQLLQDVEMRDVTFGIYCTSEVNKLKIGSLMRLENVIKRYPNGEADIIVKCLDVFSLEKLLRNFKNKMYPGGDVRYWTVNAGNLPGVELYELFLTYLRHRKINKHFTTFTLYQVAQELNLELRDRYAFLNLSDNRKESFLTNHINYQLYILHQEELSKDVFHLN